MRPAKVREQASCLLQFFELGHFRTVIKGQSLPQAWWHLAQTRNKRLARGGGRLALGLGQQQKAAFAFVATEQRCLAPGGTNQIRLTPPKRYLSAAGCGRLPMSLRPGNRWLPRGHTRFVVCCADRR